MQQSRFRQVARLEQMLRPYLKRKSYRSQFRWQFETFTRKEAFITIANLSFVILFGGPTLGESLVMAWRRCRESAPWQAHLNSHGEMPEYFDPFRPYPFDLYVPKGPIDEHAPFQMFYAGHTADYFRKYFLPDLPGAGEKTKLNAILAKAPLWLLWGCYADVSAYVLGLELPDLLSVSRFRRPPFRTYGGLPDNPLGRELLRDGVTDEFADMIQGASQDKFKGMTPRARTRALKIDQICQTTIDESQPVRICDLPLHPLAMERIMKDMDAMRRWKEIDIAPLS
jgi:hypothetical protein